MLKKLLHKCIHMWDDYDKVSDVFTEPAVKFYFGKWTNFDGLPVWRRGYVINVGKYGQYHDEPGGPWYGHWSKHQVWDENFLKQCSGFGRWWRGFVKPVYQMPDWFSFYHSNYRAVMKTKYDSWRYEFPPQFCVVVFNICFAWWLVAPSASTDHKSTDNKTSYPNCDAYWESMLEYITHRNECGGLGGVMKEYIGIYGHTVYSESDEQKIDKLNKERDENKFEYNSDEYKNWWKRRSKIKGQYFYYVCCRPEYIKKAYIDEYNNAVEEIKKSKEYKNKYFVD